MNEEKTPKIGDIVLYNVGEADKEPLTHNDASTLPAIVLTVWSDECVNLKVFCDGPEDAWETSVLKGRAGHQWSWPE